MPVQRGNVIGDALNSMPAEVTRHLTILQCAKLGLPHTKFKNSGDDTWSGASDVVEVILEQICDQPTVIKRIGRLDGVYLNKLLFKPIRGVQLTPLQARVYQSALDTAEIQMRRLYDANLS